MIQTISRPKISINAAEAHKAAISNSKWHVLLATWLGELFDGMDASIFVLVMFPAVSELLGTTSHSIVGQYGSFIMAIFMLGWAVGAIVFGILSDNIGRTKTMIITILLYAICTGLCATSQNWWELAFYRFLVGCGIGGEISIGAVMISEYWHGRSRLHAVAALNTSFGCGYLMAALLNLGLGAIGWRWLFLAGVAPALITLYIRTKLKEPEQFTVVKELKDQLRRKDKSALTADQTQLIRFTLFELFSAENRFKVLTVIGLASTTIVGYWAVLSWIPAWINQLTGTAAVVERSQAAVIMNIGAILAAAAGGLILTKIEKSTAFRLTFIGALVCCLGMFLSVKEFGPALLGWVFFAGAFATLPFVFLFAYVPELFAAHIRGTAFGFSVQVGRIVAAGASIAGGQIIANCHGSYAIAGASVALIYIVGIIASVFMPRTSGEVELGISFSALSDLLPASANQAFLKD